MTEKVQNNRFTLSFSSTDSMQAYTANVLNQLRRGEKSELIARAVFEYLGGKIYADEDILAALSSEAQTKPKPKKRRNPKPEAISFTAPVEAAVSAKKGVKKEIALAPAPVPAPATVMEEVSMSESVELSDADTAAIYADMMAFGL